MPHGRLLHKLSLLGIQGSLHAWFTDYLSSRSQRVVIGRVLSAVVSVTTETLSVFHTSTNLPIVWDLYLSLYALNLGQII